jgi:hypothetical protein
MVPVVDPFPREAENGVNWQDPRKNNVSSPANKTRIPLPAVQYSRKSHTGKHRSEAPAFSPPHHAGRFADRRDIKTKSI